MLFLCQNIWSGAKRVIKGSRNQIFSHFFGGWDELMIWSWCRLEAHRVSEGTMWCDTCSRMGLITWLLFSVLSLQRRFGKRFQYGKPMLLTSDFFVSIWHLVPRQRRSRSAPPPAQPVLESSGKIKHFIIYFPILLSHEVWLHLHQHVNNSSNYPDS